MSRTASALLLGALLGAACATQPARPESAETQADRAAAEQDEKRAQALELSLAVPRAAGSGLDCPNACSLVGEICALSERICTLARRHPGDEELSRRCQRGGERCRRARQSVQQSCPCEGTKAG
jgi:hypothetical protein